MTQLMVVTAAGLIGVVTVAAAVVLRGMAGRFRSVRIEILVIAFGALVVAGAAALSLARLMIFDDDVLNGVLTVLIISVPFVGLLVVVATGPIRSDVAMLADAVGGLEHRETRRPMALGRNDELAAVATAVNRLGHQLELVESERAEVDRNRQVVDAERRLLISSLSHDLRTPIGAIRAAAEAVVDGVAPDPDRYLRTISAEVATLSRMVEDLFLISRMEAGGLEIDQRLLDLAELADETAEAMTPLAAERRIELRLSSHRAVPVVGDAAALGRVLRNLLDNAIRHGPIGSTVTVVVGTGTVRAGAVQTIAVVEVSDEGSGFPPEFARRAFERFSRADASRSRLSGGAGLGLAIAKGLVEAHGGRISIGDVDRPGGTVRVILPLASSHRDAAR